MKLDLKRSRVLLALVAPAVVSGCVWKSDYDKLQAQNQQLDQQVSRLTAQANADKAQIARLVGAIKYTVNSDLLFPSGGHQMNPEGQRIIVQFASRLAPTQQNKLVVNGYTDNAPIGPSLQREGITSNLILSQKRAENVMQFLISQGVKPDLVTAVGHGEADPVATNSTSAGRAQNRRVELHARASRPLRSGNGSRQRRGDPRGLIVIRWDLRDFSWPSRGDGQSFSTSMGACGAATPAALGGGVSGDGPEATGDACHRRGARPHLDIGNDAFYPAHAARNAGDPLQLLRGARHPDQVDRAVLGFDHVVDAPNVGVEHDVGAHLRADPGVRCAVKERVVACHLDLVIDRPHPWLSSGKLGRRHFHFRRRHLPGQQHPPIVHGDRNRGVELRVGFRKRLPDIRSDREIAGQPIRAPLLRGHITSAGGRCQAADHDGSDTATKRQRHPQHSGQCDD